MGNIIGEAAVMVRETNEAAYLATVYDDNPEPKNFKEAQNSPDLSNWWEAMCVEFRNMKYEKFGKSLPIQVYQQEEKSLDPIGY
jgi:hypothetical protein